MTQLAQYPNDVQAWPKTWTDGSVSWPDLLKAVAHLIVQAERDEAAQINSRAVHRLDGELLKWRTEGRIIRFEIGGWRGDEIMVRAVLPEAQYSRVNRLALHARLDDLLGDLKVHVALDLDTDDGESA